MLTPNHKPLISLPTLVLDLETTGLDVINDRVIQIAALKLQGNNRLDEPYFDQLINPGIPIPPASTTIHGIKDSDVAGAADLKSIADSLIKAFKGRVIIGHHIAFDIAILRHEFARYNLVWHEPIILDISMLAGALQPALPDLSLETVAALLGVEIKNRHTAMGDCMAAAQSWEKLIILLRDKGIRTFGEALSLANLRQDLILRQVESGWLNIPDGLVIISRMSAIHRIDSYVFEHRLADVMSRPARSVSPDTSLRDAAKFMVKHKVGSLLISEPGAAPMGIFTKGDMLRITAKGVVDPDLIQVKEVMSTPVETMHQNEMLYRALARMDRMSVCFLCVVDDNNLPVGVVSERNLLTFRARGPHMLSDAVDVATDTSSLAAAYSRVTSVAERLVAEELDGGDVARVIATELQALTQRAAQLSLERMQAEGKGTAPADWCVLVLGSGGRAESLLNADQDNALIHSGTSNDDAWFARFGKYLAQMLDAAGLPLCKGGVMVSSEQWRGTIDDWNHRVEGWLRRARPEDLLNIDIFFDLVAVAGNAELAQRLHKQATELASKSHAFINLLAQSVQSIAPRFGLFGRLLITDGRLDLKRDGLLPLVSLARTLALRIGSVSRGTPERLRDAVVADRVSESDAARLIELRKKLLMMMLSQQLLDIKAGIPVSSQVDVKMLNRRQYSRLKHELHHLDTMVRQIQSFIAN